MSHVARAFYNKIADRYEEGYNTAYWRLYDQITAQLIAKYIPKQECLILDAGGGTGRWAAAMAREGHRVMLLDISEGMLEVARERIKANELGNKIIPIQGDIRRIEFEDNTFDFVIAEGAISYCSKEHQKAIGELVRVAKKGAYILASVNNRWALAKVILDKFGPKEGAEHIKNLLETGDAFTDLPVHAFTVDELKASFNSAGANVTKIYGKHTLSFLMNKEQKEELDDGEVFEKFEAFEKVLMEREELVGWAHHLLAVAKKF